MLKANKNKGISKVIFISQIGIPVRVFMIMDTPVSPPGAILWGFRNIFMEIPISKQPKKMIIISSNFIDDFVFDYDFILFHLSEAFFISLTKKSE